MIDEEGAKVDEIGIDFDRIGSILKSLKQTDKEANNQNGAKPKEIVPKFVPQFIIGIDFEKIISMEPASEMMSYIEVKMFIEFQGL